MTGIDELTEYLRQQGIAFEIHHHEAAYTAEETAAVEHVLPQAVAKTVIAMADEEPVMLVLPASERVDFARAKALANAMEMRLATENEFEGRFPGCEVGAMPPFGKLYRMKVYIDRTLTLDRRIIVPAGTHTESIGIRYADLVKLAAPTIGDLREEAPRGMRFSPVGRLTPAEIAERIDLDLDIPVVIEEDGESLVVSAMVETESEKLAVLDLLEMLSDGRPVEDNIEATSALPGEAGGLHLARSATSGIDATEGLSEEDAIEPGDFMDRRGSTDAVAASGAGATGYDEDEAESGDLSYSPPIDPVAGMRTVIGGFSVSSTEAETERSALGGYGDEAIKEAIERELREDSSTAELTLRVRVSRGRVRLRGRVPTIDDADNAANVAERVPGVREVVDELDVESGRML